MNFSSFRERALVFCLLVLVGIFPCAAQQTNMWEGPGSWYESSDSKFMASHSRLPFGTQVDVTNLENNKRATVKIGGRINENAKIIIDLASPVADSLEMNLSGTTRLRIEVVPRRPKTLVSRSVDREFTQEGTAMRMAEGTQLTAGHASLPVGSRIRVVNKANGQQATATIMYRIRASSTRILEVSDALARRLDITRSAEVTIEAINE
ncbi:MAG: septal ring lytic transglycosylase RlpA family protein [Treponema sp.]|jgi:rare lipoprotein A (peptidoglycan hydrolase)|nr:septal ring lytic transglycosylase RlpA family protein [Treponema sp.]